MLPSFVTLLKKPTQLLALGFGSGLAPKAPGTWGTLAAIPFYLLFFQYPFLLQLLIIVVAFILGIYLCQTTADALGVHDHPAIVWDEFVGFWITMLPLSLIGVTLSWQWLLVGFILFRFFDILKPWPIRLADKNIHGGLGIMFDDVLAGVYAAIILALMITFI